MKLVFVHGWGLSPVFWDDVISYLPDFKNRRVDLGYFGPESLPLTDDEPMLLIGHSLGFVHGLNQNINWCGWVAINSFPRFMKTKTLPGCTTAVELRDLRMRLNADPEKAVRDFHDYIGATASTENLRPEKLREALDELRDCDITEMLGTLAMPGLVLASRNDPLVPAEMSETLANGKSLLWHDTGGHVLPQSAPEWCTNAIRDFVKSYEQKCA